jgi:hypothetical protein
MLERFGGPQIPEVQTPQLLHTLVVLGATQATSGAQLAALDHATRIATLAAGLIVISGLAKKIALFSAAPNGASLMKNYLNDLDVPNETILIGNILDNKPEQKELKDIVKSRGIGEVGIITAKSAEKSIKELLTRSGFSLNRISLEEEIGKRIADSAKDSRQIITQIIKESFLNLIRFQKMLEEVEITGLSLGSVSKA